MDLLGEMKEKKGVSDVIIHERDGGANVYPIFRRLTDECTLAPAGTGITLYGVTPGANEVI